MSSSQTYSDTVGQAPATGCAYEELFALALRVIGAYLLTMQMVAMFSGVASLLAFRMSSDVWDDGLRTGWMAVWFQGLVVIGVNAAIGTVLVLGAPRLARFCYRQSLRAADFPVVQFSRAGAIAMALQVIAVCALLLAIAPAAVVIANLIKNGWMGLRVLTWTDDFVQVVQVVLYLAAACALWLCGRPHGVEADEPTLLDQSNP